MNKIFNYLFIPLSVLLVVGCGGGSEDNLPDFSEISFESYGAIAVNKNNGNAGISAKYKSKDEAKIRALSECGVGCIIVEEFGFAECGAYARSDRVLKYGTGVGSRITSESIALIQCTSSISLDCKIKLSECN